MKRRMILGNKKLQLFTKRFYPAGNYTWPVPPGCTEVDVFLAGAGSSGDNYSGGAGGYTKTFKKDATGWRDGGAISVNPGELVNIIVGKGGQYNGQSSDGGYSQFKNSNYRANGGLSSRSAGHWGWGGNGGSGGGGESLNTSIRQDGGSDGSNAPQKDQYNEGGFGQGHTTRDFGEATGKRNSGGGGASNAYHSNNPGHGGISDYIEGSGEGSGAGGGYGGGGYSKNAGGDGTVLIRYWAYEE